MAFPGGFCFEYTVNAQNKDKMPHILAGSNRGHARFLKRCGAVWRPASEAVIFRFEEVLAMAMTMEESFVCKNLANPSSSQRAMVFECRQCGVQVLRVSYSVAMGDFKVSALAICEHCGFGYAEGRYNGGHATRGFWFLDARPALNQLRRGRFPQYSDSTTFLARIWTACKKHRDLWDAPVLDLIKRGGRSAYDAAQDLEVAEEKRTFDVWIKKQSGLKVVQTHPGLVVDDSSLFYEGEPVVICTIVNPVAHSVLSNCVAIAIDFSWKPMCPNYCYICLHGIIRNLGVPVAVSIMPTESSRGLEALKRHIDMYVHLCGLPAIDWRRIRVLPGTAIAKFCRDNGLQQFLCFFHIFRNYGANGASLYLIRDACYTRSEEEWLKKRDPLKAQVLELAEAGVITNADKILEFIGYDQQTGEWGEFDQALYKRHGVPTCNNHSEGFHGRVNREVTMRMPLLDRMDVVMKTAEKEVESYSDACYQKAVRKKMQTIVDVTSNETECTVCHGQACAMCQITAELWQTERGVCGHIGPTALEFTPLPPLARCADIPEVVKEVIADDGDLWGGSKRSYTDEGDGAGDDEVPRAGLFGRCLSLVHCLRGLARMEKKKAPAADDGNAAFFVGSDLSIAAEVETVCQWFHGWHPGQTEFRAFASDLIKAVSGRALGARFADLKKQIDEGRKRDAEIRGLKWPLQQVPA
jgi:ribosomal protein L37AE/L43A